MYSTQAKRLCEEVSKQRNRTYGQTLGQMKDKNDNYINQTIGKSIESIDVLSDKTVIITSNSVYGFRRDGFVTKFGRIEDVPNRSVLSVKTNWGSLCNLVALKNTKVMCAFDSGHISLLNADLMEEKSEVIHENLINRLNCNRLETMTVSCGYDSAIVLLDLQTMRALKAYNYAHSDIIWDIEFSPFDDNLFMSCSRDKDVLLWDLRKAKPASRVATMRTEATALCWSQKDNSHLYIGTNCGQLVKFDTRTPDLDINCKNSSSKGIHRIKNVFNGKALAVCADESVFKVFDSDLECVYENKSSHRNWVRDVCQHNQQLYSVGADTRMATHYLQTLE